MDKFEIFITKVGGVVAILFLGYVLISTFVLNTTTKVSRDLNYACYNFARWRFMAGNFETLGGVPAEISEARASANTTKCDEFLEEECRHACYIALAEYDPTMCARIQSFALGKPVLDESLRQTGCYIHLAIVTRNETYCSMLTPVNEEFDESFCLDKL